MITALCLVSEVQGNDIWQHIMNISVFSAGPKAWNSYNEAFLAEKMRSSRKVMSCAAMNLMKVISFILNWSKLYLVFSRQKFSSNRKNNYCLRVKVKYLNFTVLQTHSDVYISQSPNGDMNVSGPIKECPHRHYANWFEGPAMNITWKFKLDKELSLKTQIKSFFLSFGATHRWCKNEFSFQVNFLVFCGFHPSFTIYSNVSEVDIRMRCLFPISVIYTLVASQCYQEYSIILNYTLIDSDILSELSIMLLKIGHSQMVTCFSALFKRDFWGILLFYLFSSRNKKPNLSS